LGRFLTRDDHKYIKDKDPQTLNLYEYARDNPVSITDPNGTNPFEPLDMLYELGAAGVAALDDKAALEAAQQAMYDNYAIEATQNAEKTVGLILSSRSRRPRCYVRNRALHESDPYLAFLREPLPRERPGI
jgi:hypothetical protein